MSRLEAAFKQRTAMMILLNPGKLRPRYSDARSAELMAKLVGFFERRGNDQLQSLFVGA